MKKPYLFKRGKYWHLEYYDRNEDRTRRITTGESKKNDAIKFLMEFEKNQKEKARNKFIMLSTFVKEYKQFVESNFSSSHLENVTISFNKLIESIGDMPINKINNKILENFIIEYYNKKSKHMASLIHRVLNAAFNKAIVWNYISINPMKNIKLPKIPYNNPAFISENQLDQILENLDRPKLKDIYIFCFHTGCRISEILTMKWNQISLNDRIIKILNTNEFTTKGKKERVIPINEKLFVLLSNKLPKLYDINNSGYVFNRNGFKFNVDYVSKAFKKAVRKTEGIDPRIHLHSLRHSLPVI